MAKFQLSDWLWVGYPVVVGVFIYLGVNFLMSGSQANFAHLLAKQEEVELERNRAEIMKNKLESLKEVDQNLVRDELTLLMSAVPPSRAVWNLINELNAAGARSGMALFSYKGTVGDVREATESGRLVASDSAEVVDGPVVLSVEYTPSTLDVITAGLAELERMLPLVKIAKVEAAIRDGNNTTLIVEGAWSPWPKLTADPTAPLPDYKQEMVRALESIRELDTVSQDEIIATTESATF